MAVDWPDVGELKQLLDIESADWDGEGGPDGPSRLSRLLAAAVAAVKEDVGDWDEESDAPDAPLAQAALVMGFMLAQKPLAGEARLRRDPVYASLLAGRRRRFAVS